MGSVINILTLSNTMSTTFQNAKLIYYKVMDQKILSCYWMFNQKFLKVKLEVTFVFCYFHNKIIL